jgi:lipoprotein-anchoring transpeptidase ErfK/SrfK
MTLSTRPRTALSVLAAAILATSVAACAGSHHPAQPAAARTAPADDASVVDARPGWSLIATAKGSIPRYLEPGAGPDGRIPASWYSAPSALPVIGQEPGWLRVRLATRPNGATAWVRRSDVTVTSTPYRIVINLATKHLQLLQVGKPVMDAPAGVGAAQDPTPAGEYFAVLFEQPPSAGYGPFVLVTSAHSDSIADWEGSGDALIGIHGPLGQDRLIGTSGAAISHGCIRLHLPDLAQLRQVPAGTPISVTA